MTTPALSARRSRGMRDLLPEEMRAFRRIEDAFRASASRWGYDEVRTPTIETYSLFTAAGTLTPQMLSRVYTFLDWDGWSGERVVLRPDSTIPVVRAVGDADIPLPARLYYIQNVFRFHESEDDREEWQCGVEYLEAPATLGELEVASIVFETLANLGMETQIRLSHVGVTNALLDTLNGTVSPEQRERVLEEGMAALRPLVASNPGAAAFVDVAMRPSSGAALLQNLGALAASGVPAAAGPLAELAEIAAALEGAGHSVLIDLGFALDFEYYSGAIFEFTADGRIWARGGRYKVAGLSTACGLALEAEQLAKLLANGSRRNEVVNVVAETPADLGRTLQVARALHRAGVAAALSPDGLSAITITVSKDRLTASTPAGTSDMNALDDVVGLLLQYK